MPDLALQQAGIYCITHTTTGLVYVGSAFKIDKRWSNHKGSLRIGKHHSKRMQAAWDRDGPSAFTIAVLEGFPGFDKTKERVRRLLELEQAWLDKLDACCPTIGFNTAPFASGGCPGSPETLAKLSAALRDRWLTPEYRAKMAAVVNNQAPKSPEARAKMAAAATNPTAETLAKRLATRNNAPPEIQAKRRAEISNRVRSAETLAKLSAARKGYPVSAEWRANMSAAAKNRRPMTAEARAKISAALAQRGPISTETRAKLSAASSNRSAETLAKMSATMRNRPPPSPETRAKLSVAGKNISAETRAKLSAAAKNRLPPSTETRAKMAAAQLGKTASVETRAKISAAKKARAALKAATSIAGEEHAAG